MIRDILCSAHKVCPFPLVDRLSVSLYRTANVLDERIPCQSNGVGIVEQASSRKTLGGMAEGIVRKGRHCSAIRRVCLIRSGEARLGQIVGKS